MSPLLLLGLLGGGTMMLAGKRKANHSTIPSDGSVPHGDGHSPAAHGAIQGASGTNWYTGGSNSNVLFIYDAHMVPILTHTLDRKVVEILKPGPQAQLAISDFHLST